MAITEEPMHEKEDRNNAPRGRTRLSPAASIVNSKPALSTQAKLPRPLTGNQELRKLRADWQGENDDLERTLDVILPDLVSRNVTLVSAVRRAYRAES